MTDVRTDDTAAPSAAPSATTATQELPATMRASVLLARHELTVEQRTVPEPERDEVLVKVAAVGVCGSDIHYYREGRIGDHVVRAPMVLGHESSGRIVAVGADVDPSRVGQRVSIEPQRSCRTCRQCKAGRYNLCPFMEFYATPPIDGAFAEFVTIQADFAYAIPDSVSDDAAALLEPLSVCIWAAQKARIAVGSRVLVAGAGPIGIILTQVARAFGAAEVIVSDPVAARRELALRFGATSTIDPTQPREGSLGVDAFVDASGAPSAVVAGIHDTGPAGVVVLVGLGADEIAMPVADIMNRELTVTGIFRYTGTWPTAIHLVASGQVDLDSLVTGHFSLDEVEEALQSDRTPGALKSIVVPS
jgi:L-iditol 2-dehydrogenase